MVFARFMGMALIALSIVFVSLWFYARTAKSEKLKAQWDSNQGPGRRESYLKAEMAAYEGTLKRKLIWGVYVIPSCLLAALIYVTNLA